MSRVELPTGWADLRDPTTVTVRERKTLLAAGKGIDDLEQAGEALMDAMLALAVEKWSFDLPLPSEKLDSIGDLAAVDYDALVSDEALDAFRTALFPQAKAADPVAEAMNPKAGPPASNGSATSSKTTARRTSGTS